MFLLIKVNKQPPSIRITMVMKDFEAVLIGGLTVILGATVLHSAHGCWGSRGQTTVYTTQYHGKQATVVREDIKFGIDQYGLLIDGQEAKEARKYDWSVISTAYDVCFLDLMQANDGPECEEKRASVKDPASW